MKHNLHHLLAGLLAAVAATVALAVATPAKAAVVFGTYSHDDPSVTCQADYNAAGQIVRRTISVDSPLMVSPRGSQQVSYQVYLYRWDPSSSSWVYDFALSPVGGISGGVYALPGNSGFAINNPGKYWTVAIKYRWYWNGGVEVTQFNWAGTHTQSFTQDLGNGVTNMWYGSTGSYCYLP